MLETALEVVGIERANLWAITPDQARFVNLAGAGFTEEEWRDFEGIEIPLQEAGVIYRSYVEGTPVIVDALHPLPRELRLKSPYSHVKAMRSRAGVVLPMIARGRTVGVIAADNKITRKPIMPESVDLLGFFASHAAIAIDNARMFQEMETQRAQLELATKHKSQFLANMSHELRTPLNAVLGYTELIADGIYGEVPERVLEILERVNKSGRHLLGLNDVLDLSRIESGRLTLQLDDYSLADVVRAVCAAGESLAMEKNLTVTANVPSDLPLGRGDERRLRQVLLNLIGNAIKFTDEGEVTVRAIAQAGAFWVSMADTGPGIPESAQEDIFREVQQADSSITKAKGGSGLGLPIARRIVELHGGRMWVTSSPGRGATFHFTLPIHTDQQTMPA